MVKNCTRFGRSSNLAKNLHGSAGAGTAAGVSDQPHPLPAIPTVPHFFQCRCPDVWPPSPPGTQPSSCGSRAPSPCHRPRRGPEPPGLVVGSSGLSFPLVPATTRLHPLPVPELRRAATVPFHPSHIPGAAGRRAARADSAKTSALAAAPSKHENVSLSAARRRFLQTSLFLYAQNLLNV